MFATGAPVMEFQRYAFGELLARFGTPNRFASNLCSNPLTVALETVCGFKSQPDYDGTKLILMWGGNPWASMRPGHNIAYGKGALLKPVLDARRAGAKLVVIDPVYTETAERADWWIPLRPGTDGALALSMLHVVIGENLFRPRLCRAVDRRVRRAARSRARLHAGMGRRHHGHPGG